MTLSDRINGWLRRVPPWAIYVAGFLYAAWYFWLGLTGGLGPEPINTLEREYGQTAIQLLIAGLAVTPLRRFAGINLLRFRRAIGVTCFFFVLAHLSVWALLDVQALGRVWADILKRPYITIGMGAFLLLLPLAVTSNNLSIRKLGPKWRQLHKLVYPAAILAAVHFIWLVKGFPWEPFIYAGIIAVLLGLRLVPRKRPKPVARQVAS
ncbi:protein-methionine-sulfoxide reductase heme-binding subunit MsrQ [Pseudoroseicyclus sp. CXY001]|uniref:protein-methionine-sulfoxide reductase heme-binding subunit MsrQ n=1 Tax=Pseudoroseicyclus sp. CXY001 TaxID=3242492 RepID=UPI0035716BFE